jgi:hypothetical protein
MFYVLDSAAVAASAAAVKLSQPHPPRQAAGGQRTHKRGQGASTL